MNFTIPLPLQHEHEALHERLRQATQAGGDVGEAAKTLARLMHRLAASHTVVSVLHDLTLALRADRLLVLAQGTVRAEGSPREPALHAALEASFQHAIRIDTSRGAHPVALPCLD